VIAAKPPLGQVGGKRREQPHRARLTRLGRLDATLAVGGLLNEKRPLAHVRPAERLRLLRAQPGVSQDRNQGRVARSVLPPPSSRRDSQALDGQRRQRPNLAIAPDLRLLHGLDRVVRDPPPLNGAAQDTLKLHERPMHSRQPHPVRFEFGPVALHDFGRDRAERHGAKSWLNVAIPELRVAEQGPGGQIGDRVKLPPLFRELGQRFPPAGEQIEIAGALAPHDLGLERLSVPLAADHLGPLSPLLVAPAHSPNRTALPLDPFDAHRTRLSVARLIKKGAQAAPARRPGRP